MGIEYRGSRVVYYRKRWRHGTVHSEYVASGDLAMLAYALDQSDRRERQAQHDREQAELAAHTAADAPLNELAAMITLFTRAALLAAGFYQHKRQWRKRRGYE